MIDRFNGCERRLRRPAALALVALAAVSLTHAQTPAFNYAEALQKSLYFYDAEKSGPGITGGRLEWRGDSEVADTRLALVPKGAGNVGTNMSQAFINANRAVLDPDGDGFVNVSGGMHDAGDHVRFGLPQAYAASTLAWGMFEFPEAFVQSGQQAHMVEILRWFGDCFLRSTFRNASGNVVAFCYQVGEGAPDHTIWAPPEILSPPLIPRPGYFATAETPASDQVAGHAAALAAIGLALDDIDPTYANRCIETAIALYRFAVANRGLGYSGGFYNSSFDHDEMSWAAVWLLQATGNMQYLADIESVNASGQFTGFLGRIVTSTADSWQNIWVHSWDTVWGGVFVRLAAMTNNPRYVYYARWNVEFWSGIPHVDPSDTNFLFATPAGYRVIANWGSARYNCAAQLCALVLRKYLGRTDFAEWSRGQMNYIMGNNPMNRSYIVGFPTFAASAQHPHHRAAHASTTNSIFVPAAHRHILWGALVGGPDTADFHVDSTNDFIYNEVAIDYNAGLVGALAGLYTYYGAGQQPLANFPPAEPPGQPYVAEAKLEQENTERTQLTIRASAIPLLPPRFETGLSTRYFFDISELIAAGQTIADVRVEKYYDQEASGSGNPVVISGPMLWAGSVYYVQFAWSGAQIFGNRELQFGLVARQDAQFHSNWNPANDWSRQGLAAAYAVRPRVPLYRNGTLVFGEEPPGGGGNVPVTGVTVTPATATVATGATTTLTATVTPATAPNPAVTWASNSPTIATVNASGVVTGVAAGSAIITATTVDGGFTDTTVVTVTPVNTLTVTPATLLFTIAAGSSTVAVASNGSWTVTDDQTWITVTPASGTNNATLTVSVTANTGATRTGIVTVTGGGLTRTVAVTQAGFSPPFVVSPTTLVFTAAGGSSPVAVTSGFAWTVTDNQPWITVTPASGANNATLTVSVTANTGALRTGIVTVTGGGLTRTVTVTQGPLPPPFMISPTTLSFTAAAGSSPVAVTSGAAWTVTDNQPWITVTPVSGVNNGTLTVSVAANPGAARTGVVTVTSGEITQTVAISQAGVGPVLTVSTTALTFTAPAGSNTFAITSNVSWTVADDQTWITATPVSGANNATITVAVTANTAATSRTGTITVTGSGLTRTISVTQAGIMLPPPCPNPAVITLPFARDGAGDFCWVTAGNINFVNFWNLQLLEVNGVALTQYTAGANLPPRINGNYYIRYVGTFPWSHFEANGTP